ncbi:hypothetical protein BKA64DRAFT_645631 [Cadophora sp. MPI-SDFR-AT-0126]|nr:hypothetical protein BKA64DRAFT_645631 [Leotiomycetes sp. MPI-SDFR-AT-0126]
MYCSSHVCDDKDMESNIDNTESIDMTSYCCQPAMPNLPRMELLGGISLDGRKISDRRSHVEWKRGYNSCGDDLELFCQDSEDTTGTFEVEEWEKFCHGVTLSDVENGVGAAGKDRIVWLDDRTSGGKFDPKDGGQERKIANPLTAQKLQGILAKRRFDHEGEPGAERRLVYISDLSPACIHALAGTAPSHQTPVLRKAIHKYLSFQTSIGLKTSSFGFPIFQLDLHLPFFRHKLETPPEKPLGHRNLIMNPQRRWADLSFLESPDGNPEGRDQGPEEMGAWDLHEVHISCVVAGSDGLRRLAYGFVDAEIEADLRNDRLKHFRCPDEDDMSSISSNDQESLFDYSPSESGTTITINWRIGSALDWKFASIGFKGFDGIRDDLTINAITSFETWIEEGEMLASSEENFLTKSVTNPSTCSFGMSEPNSTYAAPPVQTLYDIITCRHDYENFLPEADVNAGTTLKNKRKECGSPEAAQLGISGLPERMGTNPPADHKTEPRTAAITPAIAAASEAVMMTYGQNLLAFKRWEKLAKYIRTFHTKIIKGQEANGGISSRERDAALTTNNTAEAGNDFEGNHGAARVSARAHQDSAEVGVWYPTVFEELLSPSIEVQSAPVSKCNGDTASSFLDPASIYTFWDSPLEVDMNRTIGDAAEIPTLSQMPNEGSLGLNGVIDPALMQSFPSGGKLPNRSSPLPPEVQYDTIDEAKQALLDARQKALQKLQFINQQIENLERRKQNRNEAVGGLENVEETGLEDSQDHYCQAENGRSLRLDGRSIYMVLGFLRRGGHEVG